MISVLRFTFIAEAAEYRRDVCRPLAQAAHEVGKPLPSERNVDAHAVTLRDERGLQIAAHAVQQLEFVPFRAYAPCGRPLLCEPVHGGIVRGKGGVVALIEHHPHQRRVRRIHIRLVLVRDVLGFFVSALDEANARSKRQDVFEILLRAKQRRLQHDANLAMTLLPQCFEDIERHLRIRRALHVDADEEPRRIRPGEDLPDVVHRARAIDVEAELRQLERDVPADAGGDDRLADLAILARGGVGVRKAAHAFAQVIERDEQAACLHGASGVKGLGGRLAGDEPAREAPRPAHAVTRRECLEVLALGEQMEQSFRRAAEHLAVTLRADTRHVNASGRTSPAGARSSARSIAARCGRARETVRARER